VVAFCVITGLYATATVLAIVIGSPGWRAADFPFATYPFGVVGALIAIRRPRNTIAWLCLAIGLIWGLAGVADMLIAYERSHPGLLPRPDVMVAVTDPLWIPGVALTGTFLLLLFPDGRLPSARWRPLAWVSAITMVLLVTAFVLAPASYDDRGFPGLQNPFGLQAFEPYIGVLYALLVLFTFCIAASAAGLISRYGSARGIERLQLRWLMAAGAAAALTYLPVVGISLWLGATAPVLDNPATGNNFPTWLENLQVVASVPFALIPVAIGVAVLRYRLYAIDRLISRTVSYALIVGILICVYAGGVFLLGGLLPLVEGDLAVAASTLAAAALFNPLRKRVQQRVDRRFNRPRYDAELEVQRFAGRLQARLDLDELSDDLLDVVATSVQPSAASVWIRGDRS
jgi:hypothetical protein